MHTTQMWAFFDQLMTNAENQRGVHTLGVSNLDYERHDVHTVTFKDPIVAPIITARGRAVPIGESMGWTPTNTPFSDQLATWDPASQRVAGSLPCIPLSWTPTNAPFSD